MRLQKPIRVIVACAALFASRAAAQTTQWEQRISGLSIHDIAVDSTGIYLAGEAGPSGSSRVLLYKYDAAGHELWNHDLGSGSANAVAVWDHTVYVAGRSSDELPIGVSKKAFVRAFDVVGNQIWGRSFTAEFGSEATDLAVSASGIYVGGTASGALAGQAASAVTDGFIRKYSAAGDERWTQQLSAGSDRHWGVTGLATSEDGLYVTWGSVPYGGPGPFFAYLSKYDAAGNELWRKSDPSTGDLPVLFTDLVAEPAVYVGGGRARSRSVWGINDDFVSRYDSDGELRWLRQSFSSEADETFAVAADQTGVYSAGLIEKDLPSYSEWVVTIKKDSPDGESLWTKEWGAGTPETTEIASAVAVYGDELYVGVNSNSYDTVARLISQEGVLLKLDSGAPAEPPKISYAGIRNSAANYDYDGAIAQGSIFTVFGANLGPAEPVRASSLPLPTSQGLAGTSVQVTVNQTTVNAIMLYSSGSQISAILPSSTPLGDASLTVIHNGVASAPQSFTVVQRNFAMYTASQTGKGPAVVQNVYSSTDVRANTLFETARPGQIASLWGTGLGPVSGDEASAVLPGDQTSLDTHVWVGNRDAAVLYRGRSGCCAGVDQINFLVPPGVTGCYVPVAVQLNGVVSHYGSISITPNGGTCSLPWGPSSSEIDLARARKTIRLGNIFLAYGGIATEIRSSSFYNVDLWGVGSGFLYNYPVDDYGTLDGFTFSDQPGPAYSFDSLHGVNATIAVGTCMVGSLRRGFPDPQNALDAGANIRVDSGSIERLRRFDSFYLEDNLGSIPSYVVPPSGPPLSGFGPPLSVTNEAGGTGAAAVGSFTVSPRVPNGLVWTNIASINTVNRSEGIRVTWSGGDPDGFVYINGASALGQTAFSCLERASAGGFTVPPSVTLALPAAEANPDPNSTYNSPFLYLVNMANPVRFDAPGLDVGVLSVSVATMRNVSYR